MGILFTSLFFSKKQTPTQYVGLPYPLALIDLHEQNQRATLVALEQGEEYHPQPDHTGTVVVLYDSETATVIRCFQA